MRKITTLIALAISCIATITAQNSTEIQEKDKIILELQNHVAKLDKELEYYKKTLDLLNSSISEQVQDVDFKINSVIGDSKTGQIVIEGILINNGALRSIQGSQANAFDPQGNEVRTYEVSVGAGGRIAELHREIPAKFSVIFRNTTATAPILMALTLKFYSSVGLRSADISVMFRNITIEWK
jgi:hypothetical protein